MGSKGIGFIIHEVEVANAEGNLSMLGDVVAEQCSELGTGIIIMRGEVQADKVASTRAARDAKCKQAAWIQINTSASATY